MIEFKEKYTNGLYYRVYGQGDPVILLHGLLGSGRDFDIIAEGLASRFKVLVPDLPGFGKSKGYEAPAGYGIATMTDAVCFMLGSEGVLQAKVAGYSMGGRIALTMACLERTPITGLLLLSASPGIRDEHDREVRLDQDRDRALQIQREGLHSFVEAWYNAKLFEPLTKIEKFSEIFSWRLLENDAALVSRVLTDMSPGVVPSQWELLSELQVPVLFLYGALDEKYAGIANEFKACTRNAQIVEIPAVGHALPVEAPTAVIEHCTRFFS